MLEFKVQGRGGRAESCKLQAGRVAEGLPHQMREPGPAMESQWKAQNGEVTIYATEWKVDVKKGGGGRETN